MCLHSHNYPALTIPGRAASAVAVLFWPARSIWLVPPSTGNATVDKDRTDIKALPSAWAQTCVCVWGGGYPSSEDLVDGSALFQGALCHHFGSHLLHVEHEGVQRLLDMRLLVLLLLVRSGGLPAHPKHPKAAVNNVLTRRQIRPASSALTPAWRG